jgi:hypothetical protein
VKRGSDVPEIVAIVAWLVLSAAITLALWSTILRSVGVSLTVDYTPLAAHSGLITASP